MRARIIGIIVVLTLCGLLAGRSSIVRRYLQDRSIDRATDATESDPGSPETIRRLIEAESALDSQ